jgi:hypothetical protein
LYASLSISSVHFRPFAFAKAIIHETVAKSHGILGFRQDHLEIFLSEVSSVCFG